MEILIQIAFVLFIIAWVFSKLFGGVISRSNNESGDGHVHQFTIPLATKKQRGGWHEKVTKLGCACGASKKA